MEQRGFRLPTSFCAVKHEDRKTVISTLALHVIKVTERSVCPLHTLYEQIHSCRTLGGVYVN